MSQFDILKPVERKKIVDEKSASSISGSVESFKLESSDNSDNTSGNPFEEDSEDVNHESIKEEIMNEEEKKENESENGNPFGDCGTSDEDYEEVALLGSNPL